MGAMSEWLTVLIMTAGFGSVPTGLIVARQVAEMDIREVGSGNIGATNIYRILGLKWAAAVFVADTFKGVVPILLARILIGPWGMAVAAVVAVSAHIWNPWLRFKGGKGVSTAFGALLMISPVAALATLAVWGIVFWRKKIVSLASLSAAAAIPLAMLVRNYDSIKLAPMMFAAVALAGLVFYSHRENIGRLRRGEEKPTTRLLPGDDEKKAGRPEKPSSPR